MVQNNAQLVRAYTLGAAVVLVAALGSLLYMETASVMLSVPPEKLVADVTFSGGQNGAQLRTQRVELRDTETQVGTASVVQVGPTFATGRVTFSCKTCKGSVLLREGTLVTTSKSLGYSTQAAVTVTRTHPATSAVRATASGPAWNTGRATVNKISDSSQYPSGLRVTNPSSITGGTEVSSAQVIQQSDLDAVRAALTAKVTDVLSVKLNVDESSMTHITDGPPVITVTTDHKVGDEATSFTMTLTGIVKATVFSNSEARALILDALNTKVPAGQETTNDPIDISWQVQQSGPNGAVTVNGTAVGYVTPKVSTDTLRTRIRGLSPGEARKSLQRAVPGSAVDIHISPVAVQWLPLIAEHISITVVVLPAGP